MKTDPLAANPPAGYHPQGVVIWYFGVMKMGRPDYEPNEEDRKIVLEMAAVVTHDRVARRIGISDETMRKYCREELDTAKTRVDALVGKTLILQATGGPEADWTKANITAAIFYAKTRIGWVDKPELKHSCNIAVHDYSKLSDEQLDQLVAILAVLESADAASGPGGAGSEAD